jgi:hypothetical protein
VVPHGGHDFEGLLNETCVHEVVARFLRHPSPSELDTDCAATIRRPGFFTEPLPMRPVAVERAALDRLQGRYASSEIGLRLDAVMEGEQLRLVVPGGPAFPLVAVAPGRFRSAGLLGTYFRFENDGAGGRSLVLEQVGTAPLRLVGQKDGS